MDNDNKNNFNSLFINGNACNTQIQQNSNNSAQSIKTNDAFDYEKLLNVLDEIKEYFDLPKFNKDFADKAEDVKKCVDELAVMAKNKENPNVIKKSLILLKDLTIGASGSIIASGILGLIKNML